MSNQDQNRELLQSVLEILRQGERLLAETSDEHYVLKVPTAFNASVGEHYRHCLEHFRLLLDAAPAGDLDYDHRERGTLIEGDRFAALNATRQLIAGWENLDVLFIGRQLRVVCRTSYATGGSQSAQSTIGREIMYAVAHAVHHYALIGVMGGITGMKLPAGFGVAPSTLKHQQQTASRHD